MTNVALLVCAAIAGWPMFHGNPALTGTVTGALPENLELRWTFKAGAPVKSSAAIVAGKVYVGDDAGNLHAIDADTGKSVWSFKAGDSIEASPLVFDGVVYAGSADGNLYALDINTGKSNWVYKTEDKILGSPNFFVIAGKTKIVTGSYDFKLHCIDAATGQSNWTFSTGNYINGAPAIAGNKIAFGGCDGHLHILDIAGKPLADIEAGAYIPSSPALADNRVYAGDFDNEVICADVVTGEILWRAKVIFGADDGRLYVVALATGKLVWSYEIGKELTASPAVAEGLVVIGCVDGNVYAFGKVR